MGGADLEYHNQAGASQLFAIDAFCFANLISTPPFVFNKKCAL